MECWLIRQLYWKIWINFFALRGINAQEMIAWTHDRQVIDTMTNFLADDAGIKKVTASIIETEVNILDGIVEIKGSSKLLAQWQSEQVG